MDTLTTVCLIFPESAISCSVVLWGCELQSVYWSAVAECLTDTTVGDVSHYCLTIGHAGHSTLSAEDIACTKERVTGCCRKLSSERHNSLHSSSGSTKQDVISKEAHVKEQTCIQNFGQRT
jgi:hypothetical protein